jgi:hypothetical protein
VADYASLFKTRVILHILTRIRRADIAIGLLIVDYLICFRASYRGSVGSCIGGKHAFLRKLFV